MTQDEIIKMAKQSGAMFDHMTWVERDLLPMFERFAKLVAEKEREECADLLMGLHEAQSNNDNHNYYHFASNAIKELRGKTITIKTKQYKCTGCQGKWHDSEDAKHHSCKDYQ